MSATQDNNLPLEDMADQGISHISELVTNNLWRFYGADHLTLRMVLLDTFKEFCDRTEVWRDTSAICRMSCECQDCHSPFVRFHMCCIPSGCHIKNVFVVTRNGRPLPQDVWKQTVYDCCGGMSILIRNDWVGGEGNAHRFGANVSICPDLNLENPPSFIVNRFSGTLLNGLMFKMFSQSNRAWSDVAQAQIANAQWIRGINEAAFAGIVDNRQSDNQQHGNGSHHVAVVAQPVF